MSSDTARSSGNSTQHPPTLLDAALPMVTLIVLVTLTIVLFGTTATDGPLQVALFASATCAGLVAMKNGYSAAVVRDAAIGGVSSAMGAIYILLAVGALIGTWNLGGTIPTIVSYGIEVLHASIFYFAVALICAAAGAITGSSWTTAATLGVAFMGMAPIIGVSETVTAGAIVSGAYMGDKMSPLSETTILVPSLVGDVTTGEHIRGMAYTVIPAFGLALGVYLAMGLTIDVADTSISTQAATDALGAVFSISPITLLPLALLIFLSYKRTPAFLALFSTAILSGALASFTQPDVVRDFVGKPEQNALLNGIEAVYKSVATGFVSNTGNETIDTLFSRGGMASMLTTVWLILGALSFAAIMEQAGLLDRLIRPLIARATSATKLLFTVAATAVGLNVVAGDQYVAIVLPSRVFRLELSRFDLAPRMLSRTIEDTGTVTSPLVPWNSCGAYMTGVLGTPTLQYAPWALFNFLNPLVALLFIAGGFKVDRATKTRAPSGKDTHADNSS
jgi:NhaC family Na+:H+ antiporter